LITAILRPEDFLFIKRIVIFANGDLPDLERARAILHGDDFIIAADGGTRHAVALGRSPNIVVGDLDSIAPEMQRKMEETGVEILRFPRDKNETDLELALSHAISLNPLQILIVAGLGNRLDQTLGNISLMSAFQPSEAGIRLDDGVEEVFFCRDRVQVQGASGDIVSLLPWHEDVSGVVTSGLKWPLHGETLNSKKTRGISNEMVDETAAIQIKSGLLLVIHTRAAGA
jgi:thiamine pyrophosphokinase